ncbi:MAG: acyl carrier protein [Bacteroidota bacterium]
MKHFDAEFDSLFSDVPSSYNQPVTIHSVEEIEDNFKDLLLDIAQKPKDFFSADKRLKEDYGLDSLDMVELVMYCEKDFSLILRDHEWRSLRTPGEFLELINSKVFAAA